MNQRLQELALQAGMYVDLNGNSWPKSMSAEECEAAYKKFAELLVKECGKIADDCMDDNLRIKPSQHLKQLFGVEE